MKKGIFLPILAIFTIVIVVVIGFMFYQNTAKSRTEVVGEKSAQLIKTIINYEKNDYYVQDSARLAYCDSLEDLSSNYVISGCVIDGYPEWTSEINCNPDNFDIEKNFNNYFISHFNNYININPFLKGMKYKFSLENDGFSLSSEPLEQEENYDTINMNYDFTTDFKTKIDSNLNEYKNLIQKSKEYSDCINKDTVDNCNKKIGLNGIKIDKLIKFEVPSIKNPCTLQNINIKFAILTS
ncbi:MAG: hypothetical protein KJ623_04330 [Nanoarchaeota archaeon]|nr:hypothetical protein [Nanoarchaeota archaeon]